MFQVVIGEEKSIRRLYRTFFLKHFLGRPLLGPVKIRDRERDRDRNRFLKKNIFFIFIYMIFICHKNPEIHETANQMIYVCRHNNCVVSCVIDRANMHKLKETSTYIYALSFVLNYE